MKVLLKNPTVMKSNNQPNFYFSAYPLKALKLPETEKKSYLHIYKRENNSIKRPSHSKILPMTLAHHEQAIIEANAKSKNHPDNLDERESEWFASYE